MRKLVILAALSLTAALFAQEAQEVEEVEQIDESVEEVEAVEEAAPAPKHTPAVAKVEAAPAVVAEVKEVKEEKKSEYPKIKQSGGVNITPRIEVGRQTDEKGEKFDGMVPQNRRFMFTWGYKLNVAVNEQLDLTFRLSDPWGETFGATIYGSGNSFRMNSSSSGLLGVALPNAYFTWKPLDVLYFSGGLLNVASNTALDLQAAYTRKDPTRAFGNEYGNSLAGFDFTVPVSKTVKVFATAGIANQFSTHYYRLQGYVVYNGDTLAVKDTLGAYSDGRIIVGADLSFADKMITVKPNVNIMTTGKTLIPFVEKVKDENDDEKDVLKAKEVYRGLLISEGIDVNVKITKQLSVNVNGGALHHKVEDVAPDTAIAKHNARGNYLMATGGIEPVYTFGGENGKLFTARVKYAIDRLKNNADDSIRVSKEVALGHHVDARFGVAVNEKFSITPRLRYWNSDAKTYYDRALSKTSTYTYTNKDGKKEEEKVPYGSKNESAFSFFRWEIGFAASF
ncbi:MAG: hypothetical protein FWF51_07320 [Chitinivibrionia bacterium]|nr:hypothetical protein [Chitinivibrionia bacterium]